MCGFCNVGNGNMGEIVDKGICFGGMILNHVTMMGISEDGKSGKIVSTIFDDLDVVSEVEMKISSCPFCGRKFE